MKRALAASFCAFGLLLSAVPVDAQAVVHVIVRDGAHKPVDGKVSLKPARDGKSFSCSTSKGACTMSSVPGGSYIVTFRAKSGASPAPRKVVIPPSGNTDLHITAK
ncbi:MAG: carboxypeptidase-like regulatory domain-containing protein [Myxococcota bacterium]